MKTRILIIIGIVVIVTFLLSAFAINTSSTTTFVDCVPSYEQIDGKCIKPTFKILLDDPIHPNDPLIVSVEKTGYYMCDGWNASIVDTADNSTVWEKDYHTSCVVSDPPKKQKMLYPISNEINPIIIENVGRYLFQIDIDGQFLEEEFLVLNTFGGISIDRTVYPDPQFCADEFDKMYLKAHAIPCGCCNPPPGEPVCEPVPIEGHIRDMIAEEFKPCVSTIDRWAYLTENNDSVWYAFGTNYVKLKMDKTNHEKNIPISITFSGYSQCLNDFYLIVKEHIGERKVVFEEKYSQVCDESKPNNEFKTYREINLEGIGKSIVLSKGQYLVELYIDTPQTHESNYVDKVYFSSHFGTESEEIVQPEPETTYTLNEVHCFPNQVIYNDECVYVLAPTDEFPKEMTKYFSMVDDVIINFCEIETVTPQDGEIDSGISLDRCFEISSYIISDVNVIKFQSTTPPTWINIKLENLTRYVEIGSSPTFRVVESGWGSGCTSPTLEVYRMKQEVGNDYAPNDLIYKHRIVYPCPYYEPRFPPPNVLNIWDESDFTNFPICEEEGKYLIIGDSGYERLPLDYYYCGVENEN